MDRILVTPRSLSRGEHPALAPLAEAGCEVLRPFPGRQPTEQELLDVLPGCAGFLAGVEPISGRVLAAAAPELKVISRNGTGIDSIDLDAARRLGIEVRRAEGANARGVAELTFAMILALARDLVAGDGALKRRHWRRSRGIELAGRALGLVGCGRIARMVCRHALAFGMKVLAHDPCADAAFQPGGEFAWASLEQVLAGSDVVSLHCPALPDGRALIDAEALAAMKHGAYLVNTARGSLLDAAAVIEALDSGHLAGAAVDAHESEPPVDWALVEHPRVIAAAHVGGFTPESVQRAAAAAVENLLAVLRPR